MKELFPIEIKKVAEEASGININYLFQGIRIDENHPKALQRTKVQSGKYLTVLFKEEFVSNFQMWLIMVSTKSAKFIPITIYFLLLLLRISNVFALQNAGNSKKVIYASNSAPFRRELSPRLTDTKSAREKAYPPDFESIQQTPVEPALRLGMQVFATFLNTCPFTVLSVSF
nr:laminin [Hymenolepis microstoma]